MAYVSYICFLKVINNIDRRERHKTVRKQKRKVTVLLMLATISFFLNMHVFFIGFIIILFSMKLIYFLLCAFLES
jgi:hypothetical protein